VLPGPQGPGAVAAGIDTMTEEEALVEIQEILQHLEQISFVAQRDAREVLPVLEPLGAQPTLRWLEAARDLFFHDREAGKVFMRNSPAVIEKTGVADFWVEQARGFAKWVNSWSALEGFMTQVGDVTLEWSREAEQRWYDIGMRWCARNLEDAAHYFRASFRQLGEDRGIQGLEDLIAPAEKLFDERGLTLDAYLEGAVIARSIVGMDGIESWARRGADIMQAGRSRGEEYFKLESEESLRLLLDGMPGYRPRRHSRFLQLLLTAWFDTLVPMADSDWRPGRGRPMMDTDGHTLFMPAVLEDREEAIVAALHTVGHLRFDTYFHGHIESLFNEVGMEHPPIDADQRITWRPLYAHFEERMFRFQLLFDLCEDLRVDARLDRLIPGYLDRVVRLADTHPEPEQGPARVFYRYALAQYEALAKARGFDTRLQPLLDETATVVDAFRTARQLFDEAEFPEITIEERDAAYLPGHGFNTGRPVYPRRRWEDEIYVNDYDVYADNKATTEKQEEEQPETTQEMRQVDPDPDINVPQENTSGSGGRIGVGIPMPAQVTGRGATVHELTEGYPYPEWDYREQRYINEWARVQERRLDETEPERAQMILAEHAGAMKRLRRALEMQRPSRMAPLRRQLEGDELDMEAAVGYVAEKKAGLSPKPFIYRHRTRQHRDTAVLLLADMSTSIMANKGPGKGKVVDHLRAGLMMFAEAINDVGDPYAICGFASKNHDNVNYYVLKDFDDTMDHATRGRIAAVSGRLASRMGAAIRHSIERFNGVPSHHRLLLLLTDGRPADYDDGGDTRYLHEDTRMAMKEAVDKGIHPFCVTLDPSGSEYLPAIFGPGHYTVIDHVEDLPSRLPEIYLRLRR